MSYFAIELVLHQDCDPVESTSPVRKHQCGDFPPMSDNHDIAARHSLVYWLTGL